MSWAKVLELTVNDLKQWSYCPRVVYYRYTLPVDAEGTYKMDRGARAQDELEKLEVRRNFKRYGLADGRREFNLWLASDRYRLSGRLDMLIRAPEECCPVDFKDSARGPWPGWEIQLAAYGLLCLEADIRPVRRGFIYLVPVARARELTFTNDLYEQVFLILGEITKYLANEDIPAPPLNVNKCVDCEYRNFCNDVF